MSRTTKVTLTVSLAVFMASLDLFIVNIVFPDIHRDLPGSSLAALSWILTAYAIVFAALLVPAGRWADRVGRRRGFLIGLSVFAAGSAACAAAPSLGIIVAARAVQAVGAALMTPTSLGLLLPEYPPQRRAIAVAIWSAVGAVAAAAAPPIGGLLAQAGWRWVFIVNLPIALIALIASVRLLREVREESAARPDAPGAGLLIVAVSALTLAITQGGGWGWGSARIVGLFVLAAVTGAAVGVRVATHPAPLIEPVIVRTRAISVGNLGGLIFFAGFGAMVLGSVLFQTTVWHVSVLRAGLQVAPGPAMAATCAVPGGLLGHRLGQRWVGMAGALLFSAGAVVFRLRMGAAPHYASELLPSQLLTGAGVGLVIPTVSAAATAPLPPARFATGSGVLGMSRQIGSALGVAVFVAIVGSPAPGQAIAAFRSGWSFIAGAGLLAAAVLLWIGPVRPGAAIVPAPVEVTPAPAAVAAGEA